MITILLLAASLPAETRTMEVSAYCTCKECCGRTANGYTASGKRASGKMVAAPRSIPFGTQMWIPGYGQAIVEDRGGAIKSRGQLTRNIRIGKQRVRDTVLWYDRVDVLMPTHAEALKWGRRILRITITRR